MNSKRRDNIFKKIENQKVNTALVINTVNNFSKTLSKNQNMKTNDIIVSNNKLFKRGVPIQSLQSSIKKKLKNKNNFNKSNNYNNNINRVSLINLNSNSSVLPYSGAVDNYISSNNSKFQNMNFLGSVLSNINDDNKSCKIKNKIIQKPYKLNQQHQHQQEFNKFQSTSSNNNYRNRNIRSSNADNCHLNIYCNSNNLSSNEYYDSIKNSFIDRQSDTIENLPTDLGIKTNIRTTNKRNTISKFKDKNDILILNSSSSKGLKALLKKSSNNVINNKGDDKIDCNEDKKEEIVYNKIDREFGGSDFFIRKVSSKISFPRNSFSSKIRRINSNYNLSNTYFKENKGYDVRNITNSAMLKSSFKNRTNTYHDTIKTFNNKKIKLYVNDEDINKQTNDYNNSNNENANITKERLNYRDFNNVFNVKRTKSDLNEYKRSITKILSISNKKGELRKFIEDNNKDTNKPINLATMYNKLKPLSREEMLSISQRRNSSVIFDTKNLRLRKKMSGNIFTNALKKLSNKTFFITKKNNTRDLNISRSKSGNITRIHDDTKNGNSFRIGNNNYSSNYTKLHPLYKYNLFGSSKNVNKSSSKLNQTINSTNTKYSKYTEKSVIKRNRNTTNSNYLTDKQNSFSNITNITNITKTNNSNNNKIENAKLKINNKNHKAVYRNLYSNSVNYNTNKKSSDSFIEMDINKFLKINDNKKSDIDKLFDPPELSNMTLFQTSLENRFKSNILLNKYTWERKRHIVEGKNKYTSKAIKQSIKKQKLEKEIFNSIEKDQREFVVNNSIKANIKRPRSQERTSILADNEEYEIKNTKLRREFLMDFFIANALSKKNLSLEQKKILDNIKEKFNLNNGKYLSLNNYYLDKFTVNEFFAPMQDIEKKLKANRDMMIDLKVIQSKTDKAQNQLKKST